MVSHWETQPWLRKATPMEVIGAAGRSMAQAMGAARRKPGAARAAARSASWASPQWLRAMWPQSPQWIHDWCEQRSGSYECAATFPLPWSAAGLKGS